MADSEIVQAILIVIEEGKRANVKVDILINSEVLEQHVEDLVNDAQ